jgi:hypothetical protein
VIHLAAFTPDPAWRRKVIPPAVDQDVGGGTSSATLAYELTTSYQ